MYMCMCIYVHVADSARTSFQAMLIASTAVHFQRAMENRVVTMAAVTMASVTVEYVTSAHHVVSAHPPFQRQLPAKGTFVHVVSAHSNALLLAVNARCKARMRGKYRLL